MADTSVEVKPGELPYHVLILLNEEFLTSGVIISKKHVLTQAYDFYKIVEIRLEDLKYVKVRVGAISLEEPTNYKIHKVKRINVCRSLKGKKIRDSESLGVLTLTTPIASGYELNLPDDPYIAIGKQLIVSGYGKNERDYYPKIRWDLVQKAYKKECEFSLKKKLNTLTFCVKGIKKSYFSVTDAGSPIVAGRTIVGILSEFNSKYVLQKAEQHSLEDLPAVVISVFSFRDYINEELSIPRYDSVNEYGSTLYLRP